MSDWDVEAGGTEHEIIRIRHWRLQKLLPSLKAGGYVLVLRHTDRSAHKKTIAAEV